MPTIADFYEYAKLATGAYVTLDGQPVDGGTIAQRSGNQGRLPRRLANQTFDRNSQEGNGRDIWFIPSSSAYYGNDAVGFAATLFQKSNQKVLAIRGTEASSAGPLYLDLVADIAGIGVIGMALTQAVSMVNYLMRLRTRADHYVAQIEAHTSLTDPGVPSVQLSGIVPFSSVYVYFTSPSAVEGLGLIGENEKIKVTGHSLGGHLAALAARLFPDLVEEAYIYNAPGFNPSSLGILASLPQVQALVASTLESQLGSAAVNIASGQQATDRLIELFAPYVQAAVGQAPAPGPGFANLNIHNLESEDLSPGDDASFVASFLTGQQVFGEETPVATEANSHLIEPFMDALGMHALLASMNFSLTMSDTNKILGAMSRKPVDSEESSTRSLYKLLTGAALPPNQPPVVDNSSFDKIGKGETGARDIHYGYLIELENRVRANQSWRLESLIDVSEADIVAGTQGADSLAYRYALRELNPFVVTGDPSLYSTLNADGDLNLYASPAATPRGMTTWYIEDRAAFLYWKVLANIADATSQTDATAGENWRYTDLAQNYTVHVSGGLPGTPDSTIRRRAVFGGTGADALQGEELADRLYGGLGTDLLTGGAGDDYLEGGAGVDVYQYNARQNQGTPSNDGADNIRDTDGRGLIRYTYAPNGPLGAIESAVVGGVGIKTSEMEWLSPDGKFTYTQQLATGALEVSINGDAGGTIRILDFDFAKAQAAGFMAIWLVDVPGLPVPARVIEGDLEPLDVDPNTSGTQTDTDEFGNLLVTTNAAPNRADTLFGSDGQNGSDPDDSIVAGGGEDVIDAKSGDDIVQGGTGRDTIIAGTGNDLVEASANGADAGDIVEGGEGADRLYADARFNPAGTVAAELAAALAAGEAQAASGLKGDFLSAGPGNDIAIGAVGDDVLAGGAGSDILVAGSGNDYLLGDSRVRAANLDWDVTRISTGQYPIPAPLGPIFDFALFNTNVVDWSDDTNAGADSLYGGAGNDWIDGGAGDDFLDAGSGHDVVFGNLGNDILFGGAGNDVLDGDHASIAASFGGDDYLDGGEGNDWLYGRGGSDILFGGAGDDQVEGNEGNDILVGGPGSDVLKGGTGKDSYVLHRGDGFDAVFDSSDTANVADASVVVLSGEITRGAIKFRPGSLIIDAGAGDGLWIEGFDPDDPLSTPVLSAIHFADGDFMTFEDVLAHGFDIAGSSVDDEIYGTAVTDRILAGDGNDYIEAKAGDDTVDGGTGDDEIYAGEGNDTVTAGDGVDFVDAAGGDDTIEGGLGDDTLEGGGGADVISGGEGQDLIFGNAGDDILNGDGGDDTLEGGSGNDTLTGGAGTDAYVLYAGMGSDTVTDGEGGEANVLQLGAGLSVDSLGTGRVGDDLVVRLRGLKDAVTITDYYTRAQDWVVRDMAGVETDLETVINQPDPYAGDYIARLWADTRLGSIAQVLGRAYEIGWTPLDGDTFESYYESAYLSVVRETTNSTYIRVDPPHDILAQTSTESTSSTVETFTGFSSPTFHWLLNSFEPSYLESDDGFFQAPLGQLPQTQASGQAVLTLKPDRQLTHLNYQSSSFPGLTTQVPYDTGNGTVEALVISQLVHESYNEFADVTRVDLDTSAWPGQVNDVFGNRVLANMTRVEDHYLSVRELRGGASDNFIFASTAGLLFPLVTLIDGGAGNDTLQGDGALLYGNAGDDELRGADAILIGGDGNDTITGWGGSTFVYTSTEVGVDTVADIAFYSEAYLDWYYDSLDVEDWRESAEVGGKYRAEFGDEESGGGVEYYDTLEDAQAAGGSNITFIEPLPGFAPVVGRGDAEVLAALEDAGVLKRDAVRFGPGLTLNDLDLTVTVLGAKADQYPGDPLQVGGTLAVRWGSGAGFDVEVPDANYGLIGDDLFATVTHPQGGFTYPAYQDYRLGLGVELFEFADGATYLLEEVLQQAEIVVDYGYDFERGTGSQTIEQEWLSVDFAPDIAPSDLYFVFGSIDMRFGVIGDSAFGIIPRWYGNVFETPQIEFRFADGTVYDPDTVTRMGRTYTGSEFGDALTADFFFSSALIGNGGDDFLGGRQGNDLLDAGPGHDFLSGAEGNDIYAFGYDSEVDSIYDYEPQRNGLDTVRFRDDVVPGDVSVAQEYDTLKIYLAGSSAELWINGWFLQEGGSTEVFVFADGTTWDAAAIETLLPQPIATSGDDQLFGFTGGDTLDGLDGDDEIHGFAGHDTLRGGPGDDLLGGDAGDDVYEFGPGDGHDLVFDRRGFNTVSFGPGIEASEAVVTRDDYNLYIVVDEGRGRVGIVDWFWQAEAKIAQATFADGTTWDAAELESRVAQVPATEFDDIIWATDGVDVVDALAGDDAVYGRGGDDILDGGDGADELRAGSGHNIVRGGSGDDYLDAQAGHSVLDGGVGNDHLYYDGRGIAIGGAGDDLIEVFGHNGVVAFNPGDGADTVYATTQFTLSLGGGIGPSDLSLAIDGPDLVVSIGAQDSVRLTNDNGGPGSWPLVLLQLFGSAHIYNFSAVIDELYTRNAADPSVTELALGDVLPGYLFISSETGALGGIIAHQYATRGSIAHVPDEDLLPVLQDPQFGAFFQSTEYAGSNSAPLLESPLADATASEDSAFAYQVPSDAFSDPDEGDVLSYSAALAGGSGFPAWLSFDAETGTFTGTPLQADVGAAEITVTVSDSGGLTAEDTFTLTVENVNDAPVVTVPLADLSFEAQTPFSFAVPAGTFADEDPGDSLALSGTLFGGVALPAWLAFDPATATFAGSPATADIGIYHLQVTATDTAGAVAASDFGLVVHAVAGSEVDGTAGDDVLYGGTGDETLSAKGGNDYLYGDVGNDLLKGDDGQDVLQGGEGADVLRAGKGEDVLDGGAGDDLIFGGTGSSLIVGGIGNDTIRTRSGSDLILFNRGDGMDTVIADGTGDNTLSFGGGIRYGDLTLSRDGKDLIVDAGGGDGLVLRNWYANKQSVLNLQIILDASDEFDAASSDPLYNRKVQTFDFQGMVGAFDEARAQSPGLTSWAITNALLAFHLSGVDDFAIGGDLAYWYGKKNSFAGISLAAAQQVIGAASFGSDAQSLRPFSGLQEGFVKLA